MVPKVSPPFLSFAQRALGEKNGKEKVKEPHSVKFAENSSSSVWLLCFVTLNLDMKILYLLLAVLLTVLQSSLGFMRVPNNEAQCEQAGGICSKDHCFHLHTRAFGHCQRGVPCCRTVMFTTHLGFGSPRLNYAQ
uniref:Avian beta-defensin 8 n=1 Tax=Gallus gallus TaxID=9031 RepID=A0A8V0YDC7_CHICK